MNSDHKDALVHLSRAFGGIEAQEVEMTSVDRLGFHVRGKTQEGMRGAGRNTKSLLKRKRNASGVSKRSAKAVAISIAQCACVTVVSSSSQFLKQ